MSPTFQAILMFLSTPLAGILVNFILAKTLPAHGTVRKFTTSYLASTPGQVMAVGAALASKKSADILQAVDAVATGVSQAAKASIDDSEPVQPGEFR